MVVVVDVVVDVVVVVEVVVDVVVVEVVVVVDVVVVEVVVVVGAVVVDVEVVVVVPGPGSGGTHPTTSANAAATAPSEPLARRIGRTCRIGRPLQRPAPADPSRT